ncbi:hypothetical protein SUDANB6_00658 [Streptomyces sp. enrichment culture]|uniref:DUF2510 domain-containing protein n=1 Tax=Streptomyces sp. enrichment culture TaxID=1795815 RepID=UPI003F57E239
MTQVTPPGWYPDPGQTSDGPATERWWDGKAWTDRIRSAAPTAGSPPAADGTETRPGQPAAAAGPGQPGHGDQPAPPADTAHTEPPAHTEQPARLPADAAQPMPPAHPGPPAPPGQPPFPGQPVLPGYPVHPAQPPAGRLRGLRTGIAVGLAAAVLASIGVGVYALTDGEGRGDGSAESRQQDWDRPGGPFGDGDGGASPSPDPSDPPRVDSGAVTDALSGISLPVPDGWYGQEMPVGAQVTSDDSYPCPGDTSQSCTKGGAYSAPAMLLGTEGGTAEEVAKADIAVNAEESYGKGYGSITSHEVLASEAVTVAGQKGYLVRWKAVTSKGSDGYVESLAFPAPRNPEQIVVVRFGVDVGEGQGVIDEITKGIEKASGGGSGQDV